MITGILSTLVYEGCKYVAKQGVKELGKVLTEETVKTNAESVVTKSMAENLGEKLGSEHVALGKLGVENSELVRHAGSNERFLRNGVREAKSPRRLSTINEGLEGKTYPGTNVEYRRRTFAVNGEKVEGVFPRFESKFDTTLPRRLMTASDTEQFKYCTQKLAQRIEYDPGFASRFTPRQLEQIKNGEPRISGLTWHHSEVERRMQLVNADVHSTCRHSGGRSIWGGGANYR